MKKANIELRDKMHELHVPVWAIAAAIGVHENTMLRRMRTELTPDEHDRITQIVEKIAKENAEQEVDK